MSERRQGVRIALLVTGLLAAWGGLGCRLAYLHMGRDAKLRERVEQTRKVEQPILVGRGRILDRGGNILALDLAVKHVSVDPLLVYSNGHRTFVARQLARVLQVDPALVMAKLDRTGRRQEYVKKYAREDQARQLMAMGLDKAGVFFDDVSQRNYPHHQLFCHLLGFSNQEGVGAAGLELKFDPYLKGAPGLRVSERDGRRHELLTHRTLEVQPQQGADVYLTVDQQVQFFCEQALDAAMEKHHARGAWALVQEVRTGRLLAMACRPAYDLNDYGAVSNDLRLNRAIGYVFEPGSTFKMATIAAALNERVTDPRTIFDCENGRWLHAGRILRDYHPHGRLNVADVLKVSSNIGAAKIAGLLGEQRLHRYLRDFGFGAPLGVDLPGEEAGILHHPRNWSSLSVSRIAMGQGVAVTALQMLNLMCCIGNDGFLMRPLVVDRVVNKTGAVVKRNEPYVLARPIRGDTARLMCQMLARVTEEGGTGTKACVPGYTVAGKTGSAQKALPGGYSESAHVASFLGMLPAERPQIAIMVVVDEPQPLHTGGQVAAPIFREIAEQAVRYLDIPPVPAEQVWAFGDRIPQWES